MMVLVSQSIDRAALRRARPDAEVRRLLLQLSAVRPPTAEDTVATVRRNWQLAIKAFAGREPVGDVTQRDLPADDGPVRIRVYTPPGPQGLRPALVWFHGGGFVFGDLYTAGATCRALANRSRAVVVAVDYRLAPEHPLEAGREDCMTVVRWLADNGPQLGIDPAKLAIGGDSAGGGIAALVAQQCVREGLPLEAQVLVYPATDLAGTHPSASERLPGTLTPEWIDWIRRRISEVSDLADPSASALSAPDLAGLPPAIVLTAGFDPLRDEGLAYVERLRQAGVPVRLLHFPGQIHGFVSMDRVLGGATEALDRLGSELARAMSGRVVDGSELDLPAPASMRPLLWAHPQQRWRESVVLGLLVRDAMRR